MVLGAQTGELDNFLLYTIRDELDKYGLLSLGLCERANGLKRWSFTLQMRPGPDGLSTELWAVEGDISLSQTLRCPRRNPRYVPAINLIATCFFKLNLLLLEPMLITVHVMTALCIHHVLWCLLGKFCFTILTVTMVLAAPTVKEVVSMPPLDIDQNRQPGFGDAQIEGSAQGLEQLCGDLLQRMHDRVDEFPAVLKYLAKVLYDEAAVKFPACGQDVIITVFFLRYICPAIVTPWAFGVVDEALHPLHGRSLILLSKLLQVGPSFDFLLHCPPSRGAPMLFSPLGIYIVAVASLPFTSFEYYSC